MFDTPIAQMTIRDFLNAGLVISGIAVVVAFVLLWVWLKFFDGSEW